MGKSVIRVDPNQLKSSLAYAGSSSEFASAVFEALAIVQPELTESRRQFASLLRGLSGLFYRCELRSPWRMSFISEGIEPLTGYRKEELERSGGWAEIMVPADCEAVELAVAKAIAERTSFEVTYRIKRKNGETRWVAERGHGVYDEAGAPFCLEGVITDVSGRKEADELQRTLLSKWRKTLDTIPQMVWTMAADGSDEFYNRRWLEFTGQEIDGLNGLARLDLVHPDDRDEAERKWLHSLESGEQYEAQYRLKHVSGEYRWVLSRGCAERGSDGEPIRWYGTCTDVHDEVLAREAQRASEAVNRSMIEASPDCISLLDLEGNVVFLNAAARRTVGLDSALVEGRPWGEMFPASIRGPAQMAIKQAQGGRTGHFSASQPSPGGTRWWDVIVAPIKTEEAAQTGIISIARDITHQKTAEERVRWAANHDPLTLLPNRTLFQNALDQRLVEVVQSGGRFAVLMMDLDDFKRTNDALGHDAGDALLREFSARLRKALRADDVVARLGGDEFAVLLRDAGCEEDVEEAVGAIPFTFDRKLLDIRSSIGASIFPHDGTTRTDLLKHADIALYVAKATGRGGLRVFQPEMRAEVQHRMSMLTVASDALAKDRISPYYQPKFDLRSGRLEGFEALLRWKDPRGQVQLPGAIAAAFEDVTLAAEISDRIIDRVIADMQRWRDDGVPFGHVAINAAAAEFRRGDFADRLLERLHAARLAPSHVQLEVTETVFLGRGSEHVETALKMLAREGVQIALDDFGTGYASLSHLNHFPVNVIKIDRSFISNLVSRSHDAAIVRAVINLGRSLGIRVVAEGVETPVQMALLKKFRCDLVQGYLFGRAESAEDVPSRVQAWSEGHPALISAQKAT
jgi:diguanylate cyclase (GGDEF)-like protein/PAS domain S-box-containing protein